VGGVSCPKCGGHLADLREERSRHAVAGARAEYERGRRYTLIVVAGGMALTLSTLALLVSTSAADGSILRASLRTVITAALLYFLYQGHGWARVITILLYSLAAPVALLFAQLMKDESLLMTSFMLAFCVFAGGSAIALLRSKSIRTFLHAQRHPEAMDERFGEAWRA